MFIMVWQISTGFKNPVATVDPIFDSQQTLICCESPAFSFDGTALVDWFVLMTCKKNILDL